MRPIGGRLCWLAVDVALSIGARRRPTSRRGRDGMATKSIASGFPCSMRPSGFDVRRDPWLRMVSPPVPIEAPLELRPLSSFPCVSCSGSYDARRRFARCSSPLCLSSMVEGSVPQASV